MKKIVLSFAAMLSFLVFANAQVAFSVMPKAGVSFGINRMGLSNYTNKKMEVGLVAGVGFPISFSDYFEVQPEFYFIQKNSKYTFNGDNGTGSSVIKQKLNQFELPVLAKVKFSGFYVEAGPSITFNSKGTDDINSSKTDIKFGSAITELKKTGWSAQIGAGYNFEVGSGKLNLDARYGLGFTDMDNVTGTNNTTKVDAIAVSVGYIVPLTGTSPTPLKSKK